MEQCEARSDETVANIILTLIFQRDPMLAKVLKSLEAEFIETGRIKENMSLARRQKRGY